RSTSARSVPQPISGWTRKSPPTMKGTSGVMPAPTSKDSANRSSRLPEPLGTMRPLLPTVTRVCLQPTTPPLTANHDDTSARAGAPAASAVRRVQRARRTRAGVRTRSGVAQCSLGGDRTLAPGKDPAGQHTAHLFVEQQGVVAAPLHHQHLAAGQSV